MAKVRFSGPLFEQNLRDKAFRRASRKGMSRAGAQIEATVRLYTPADTGAYKRTIGAEVYRNDLGVIVRSDSSKPIRTWLERGTRLGVKLARSNYMWRKGKQKARQIDYQRYVGDEIARELNG